MALSTFAFQRGAGKHLTRQCILFLVFVFLSFSYKPSLSLSPAPTGSVRLSARTSVSSKEEEFSRDSRSLSDSSSIPVQRQDALRSTSAGSEEGCLWGSCLSCPTMTASTLTNRRLDSAWLSQTPSSCSFSAADYLDLRHHMHPGRERERDGRRGICRCLPVNVCRLLRG